MITMTASLTAQDMITALADAGGFTCDPLADLIMTVGALPEAVDGWVVARPETETIIATGDRERFAEAFANLVEAHFDTIVEGAMVGGWYSAERNAYMIEIVDVLDVSREEAMLIGWVRNQEAIFNLATGETIMLGGVA